jgi:hypothetical protein
MSAWDQLEAMPIATVIEMAGLRKMRDRWGPCPACGHEGDRGGRGPLLLSRDGHTWLCTRCDTRAGGPHTARFISGLSAWGDVFRWAEDRGWVDSDTAVPTATRGPDPQDIRGRLPAPQPPPRTLTVPWGDGTREVEVDLDDAHAEWLSGRERERADFWETHRILSPLVRDDRVFGRGWSDNHTDEQGTRLLKAGGVWTFWEVLSA